jgi:hypothetical protein
MASTPRQAVSTIALNPRLARGSDERFTGYGAMGVPYSGGHYLAFRDILASSLGKTYRAIWHRDPAGRWTIFTTTDPDASCPRYFGSVTAAEQVPAIEVTWTDDWAVDVRMGARLSWRLRLGATPATRAMTSMGAVTPQWAWNSDAVLGPMGSMAAGFLRSGRIRLHGRTPNGQGFKAAPLRVWRVVGGRAELDGADMGALAPLREQTRLGDFWLPQRGLFFAGEARFTAPVTAPVPIDQPRSGRRRLEFGPPLP